MELASRCYKMGFNDFNWDSIEPIQYKKKDNAINTFKYVTRYNLLTNSGTDFDVRYFELKKEGFTTLEKHRHEHFVIVARGKGLVFIKDKMYDALPFDIFIIPGWSAHQLINHGEDPFGFFCIVNSERDQYRLLNDNELKEIEANSDIFRRLKIPDNYPDI
jgi:quercetin dioxygenase-like cupin family protein